MKKLKIYATFFVAVLCVTLCGGRVFATSVYDDVYHTTNSVVVNYPSESLCNNVDITNNWADYITDASKWVNPSDASNSNSAMSQARTSFLAAIADEDYGTWSVVSQVDSSSGISSARIVWSTYPSAYLQWQTYGLILKPLVSYVNITCEDQVGDFTSALKPVALLPTLNQSGRSIAEPTDGSYSTKNLFIHSNDSSFNINYPSGYAGEALQLWDTWSDMDGDGLVAADEIAQGTSDLNKDTDGDGLYDDIESDGYLHRDDVFCDDSNPAQCAYPDPLTKDIFVEIDWLDDGTEYKPTSTQLGLVEDMFDNKGINIHFDTGQYGGGQELSIGSANLKRTVTSGQVDYWDYVNGGDGITAKFAANRDSIWRYMIYGYGYPEDGGSHTGWGEIMGDNLFISGGLIEDMTGLVSLNRAIAGTIAHEIGHNLCLGERKWSEQPLECAFAGIDNDDNQDDYFRLQDYESVLNYRYQLTNDDDLGVVDYSDGSNGIDDHDDWSAVMVGMGGFSGTKTALGAKAITTRPISPDGDIIAESAPQEITNTQAEGTDKHSREAVAYVQGNSSNEKDGEVGRPKDSKDTEKVAKSNLQSNNWIVPVASSAAVLFLVGASVDMWYRNR